MPNQEATPGGKLLVEEFICSYGIQEDIHTDQGHQIEAKLFQELCRLLDKNVELERCHTAPSQMARQNTRPDTRGYVISSCVS